MAQITAKLTILFEDPFWVGIYERTEGKRYEVCKITFGAEPRDYEVYAFLTDNWERLRFSPSIDTERPMERRRNPKRVQREVKRELQGGVGTKAQQALQQMREQMKARRKTVGKAQKEAEKERRFALREEKRREKHAGH